MKLLKRFKEYYQKKEEERRERDERRNSIDCPYCGSHYILSDIIERQQPTGLGNDNITLVKCFNCKDTFSVEYYCNTGIEGIPGWSTRTAHKLPFKIKGAKK
ncbi:hypothetical protein LCGC14_1518410 [marine sediment metagenome]|uniref:Uncharacterized protein n=1 Tax=marine sediment metagenome TaxID=412755 RepID=A0A0F9IZL4_9ZZZZ